MFLGTRMHRLHQAIETLQNQVTGLAHLQGLRRVDDIGRGHAEVQPPRRRSHVLGDVRRERDDVVLGGLLDFLDFRDIEGTKFPDVLRGFDRDEAGARHGVGGCDFDLQPRVVLMLVAPDATHFRMGVPPDHRSRNPPLTERQPFPRNLQAIDRTKHRGSQRSIGKQIARDALDVLSRHAFDAL